MENLGQLLFISIIIAVTLPALLLITLYLLPKRTSRAQIALAQRPRRAFAIGVINLIFFSLLSAILTEGGDLGGLLAFLVVLTLLAFSGIGICGYLLTLRERMFGSESWVDGGKTAVLLTLALLTPVVGWFILAPLVAINGLGAAIMTLRSPRQKKSDSYE